MDELSDEEKVHEFDWSIDWLVDWLTDYIYIFIDNINWLTATILK